MTVVRWDPFRDLVTLSDRLNRAISEASGPYGSSATYGTWTPPVDIFEKEDSLVLLAELPGLRREDIDVRIENNVLTLHGERRREPGFDESAAHRLERVYGSFTRSFSLPATVSSEKITASYQEGILEIVLPKAEEAKPKRILIESA